jgi:hypothetical protein
MNSKHVLTILLGGIALFLISMALITKLDQDVSRTQIRPPAEFTAPADEQAPDVAPLVVTQPVEIKMITPSEYAAEIDSAEQVLIQLCQPKECVANRAVLERVAAGFIGVKFVQMSTADNQVLAARTKQQRDEMKALDASKDWDAYPVYMFKGAELYVAPPITSEDELKVFISMNASFEEPADSKETPVTPN